MIDPRLLREAPDQLKAAQVRRGLPEATIDKALDADTARRAAIVDFEHLRAEQKAIGKQISRAQGEEKQELLA
ncbi:MAG TPA: serine--tRNA ligase, partial [Marmoricola sp.]|nr:serine--tRNA ligase [Marmoricola sp.]